MSTLNWTTAEHEPLHRSATLARSQDRLAWVILTQKLDGSERGIIFMRDFCRQLLGNGGQWDVRRADVRFGVAKYGVSVASQITWGGWAPQPAIRWWASAAFRIGPGFPPVVLRWKRQRVPSVVNGVRGEVEGSIALTLTICNCIFHFQRWDATK